MLIFIKKFYFNILKSKNLEIFWFQRIIFIKIYKNYFKNKNEQLLNNICPFLKNYFLKNFNFFCKYHQIIQETAQAKCPTKEIPEITIQVDKLKANRKAK